MKMNKTDKQNSQQRKQTDSAKSLMLPKDSVQFLQDAKRKSDINLFLACNRFSHKIPGNKKQPLLYKHLQSNCIEGKECCIQELRIINERNHSCAKQFAGYQQHEFQSERLIIGMGGDTPFGNIQLIKLHHLYGIPYIPASALKGSLRNCWITEKFSGDENAALQDVSFRRLFGAAAGGIGEIAVAVETDTDMEDEEISRSLVFFDAFPRYFKLGLDVQTPHFKTYYDGGDQYPTDDDSPVPIFSMCLYESKFTVLIACRNLQIWNEEEENLSEMVEILFSQYGIGAKTALGYGIRAEKTINKTGEQCAKK